MPTKVVPISRPRTFGRMHELVYGKTPRVAVTAHAVQKCLLGYEARNVVVTQLDTQQTTQSVRFRLCIKDQWDAEQLSVLFSIEMRVTLEKWGLHFGFIAPEPELGWGRLTFDTPAPFPVINNKWLTYKKAWWNPLSRIYGQQLSLVPKTPDLRKKCEEEARAIAKVARQVFHIRHCLLDPELSDKITPSLEQAQKAMGEFGDQLQLDSRGEFNTDLKLNGHSIITEKPVDIYRWLRIGLIPS